MKRRLLLLLLPIVALLGCVGVVLGAGTFLLYGYDLDGDGSMDSVHIGGTHIHVFTSKANHAFHGFYARERGKLQQDLAADHRRHLQHAVRQNDFVFEFLHRDNPKQVETVRRFAEEVTAGRASDRERVEALMAWLDKNWDFTVEPNIVNAGQLLERKQGMCETYGFLVGTLDTIGIKAREVGGSGQGKRPMLGVEVWLEDGWYFLSDPSKIHDSSLLEYYAGLEDEVYILYYWRDFTGYPFPRRHRLWYSEPIGDLFRTADGVRDPVQTDTLRLSN